jgi:hypothetical protein
MTIKEKSLTESELNILYDECLQGKKSIKHLTETEKEQLYNLAQNKIKLFEQNLFDTINDGIITLSMIGNDFDAYVKRQTKNEQNIINWLSQKEVLPPQQAETKKKTDKVNIPQIALIHFYERIQITRENAAEIAAKHGYKSKLSGEGLFQDYSLYCSTANRKGKPTPCTPKKLENRIELFESIIPHLTDKAKQRADDEIQILKTLFENEYQ